MSYRITFRTIIIGFVVILLLIVLGGWLALRFFPQETGRVIEQITSKLPRFIFGVPPQEVTTVDIPTSPLIRVQGIIYYDPEKRVLTQVSQQATTRLSDPLPSDRFFVHLSPDGTKALVAEVKPSSSRLYASKEPRVKYIYDLRNKTETPLDARILDGIVWLEGGEKIAYIFQGDPPRLNIAGADGTNFQTLFTGEALRDTFLLFVSDDQKRAVFFTFAPDGLFQDAKILEIREGVVTTAFPSSSGDMVWNREGSTILFTESSGINMRLKLYDVARKTIHELPLRTAADNCVAVPSRSSFVCANVLDENKKPVKQLFEIDAETFEVTPLLFDLSTVPSIFDLALSEDEKTLFLIDGANQVYQLKIFP
ncbi:MAG: hypothetical protein HY459_00500 [Parcubacteria group bacterium]|nr:hypothetical protein [Parcubacteria group bacterium]